jgi:LuxR family maltose regulon positive regulatory protein
LHGFVLNLFTTSLRLHGHIHTAEQTAHQALYISRRSGDLNMILDSYLHLAHVYLDRGKLHYAAETCMQAIQFAQEKTAETSPNWLVSLGNIYAIYSQVLWEWNQLPLGLSFAQKAVKLSQRWGQPNSLAFAYYTLAKLLQASGSSIEATQAIQSAYQVAEKISPQYSARKSRQIAMFHFAQNDFLSAEFWVNTLPSNIFTDLNASHLRDYVAITKIWLSLNQNQRAIDFLNRWLPIAVESNLEVRILEAKILLAIAQWQIGEEKEALQVFEAVLKRAQPEGFIRTFVILGKPTVKIMAQYFLNSEKYGDYILSILNALDPKSIIKNGTPLPISTHPKIKLSDREVQVLRYLQTNLTLPEIASELQISTHTIRSHTKNIYAKLEVNRRSYAVNRAKSLDII